MMRLIALALACAGGDRIALAAQRPNILLILADDLGWADLGCYGADLHETPALDRLAASGVRFTTAYSAAPVCTPTRASILSGKHPARLQITTYRESVARQPRDRAVWPPLTSGDLPLEEITLAERLAAVGYRTLHVGKWHLGDARHFPETQGYDWHIGGNHWGAPKSHWFPFRGQAGDDVRFVPGLFAAQPGDYLADALTDAALDLLRRAGDQPWFMTLWHYAVHAPIEAPAALTEHFASRQRPDDRHRNATYAAMVKNLDDNVGRLLAKLAQLPGGENTIVIFTSDNGGYLGPSRQQAGQIVTDNTPLRSGKGSLYEGGIRVPLIVRAPGVTPAGKTCDAPVVSTDLYRTVIELAAAEGTIDTALDEAQQHDGQSLLPLLRDPTRSLPERALHWHFPHYYPTTTPVGALRAGRWKLVEYFEDQRAELFDLAADPRESTDLAAQQPERVQTLREQLHAWQLTVKAPMPTRPGTGE